MTSFVTAKYDTVKNQVLDPNVVGTTATYSTDIITGKVMGFFLPDGTTRYTPYILAQGAIPMYLQSSGSVAANGALTGLTPIPYSGVAQPAYMYFPAGAVYSASLAGLYYVIISGTTTATIYNNTYTSGNPVVISSPTPIVAAGPGAYVQTTAEITLMTNVLGGGSMGVNGALRIGEKLTYSGSTNAKTFTNKLSGQSFNMETVTTAGTVGGSKQIILSNRGIQNSQIALTVNGFQASWAFTSSNPSYIQADTSINQSLSWTAQLAAATDFVCLEAYSVEVMPS